MFLAFQYPVELPGVGGMSFLRAAVNARRLEAGEDEVDQLAFVKMVRAKAGELGISDDMLKRAVNVGFSGGEKKRYEILQMALLEPSIGILDETDSGLDVDALKIVSDGVNMLRAPERTMLVITHYQRLLNHIVPDHVHILAGGKICKSGGKELALEVEESDMPALMMQPDLSNLVVSGPVRNAALTAWQQQGWPGPRVESWRFTKLDRLGGRDITPASSLSPTTAGDGLATAQGMGAHAIRIINGIIDPASLEGLPAGLAAGNLHDDQDAQDAMMALAPPDHPVSNLSMAVMSGGLVLDVAGDVAQPLALIFLRVMMPACRRILSS